MSTDNRFLLRYNRLPLRDIRFPSGEETAHSDVDVLVLGDLGFAEVKEALHPAQHELQREINPVVYRTDDFRAKLAANSTWAREVVEKPKLFLIGDANDFAKLIKN